MPLATQQTQQAAAADFLAQNQQLPQLDLTAPSAPNLQPGMQINFAGTNPAVQVAQRPINVSVSALQAINPLLPNLLLQAGINPLLPNLLLPAMRPDAALLQPPGLTNRPAVPLYLDYDEQSLTEYQILLRQQIELFEAGPDDVRGSAQGRNNPIHIGQVGIRCRHCAILPKAARNRGAVYYSKTIDGLYQVAQNMSKLHLCKMCHKIPDGTQLKLIKLGKANNRASGGKEYWAEGLRVLGVYEDGNMLRFRPPAGAAARSSHNM
jgi:hypothetical protein